MPQRPFSRDQIYLLPPRLDEWISPDHPARFVAAWLEDLPPSTWTAMGIDLTPANRGEARYAPQALLAIWVYGFMVGIRSTRALEQACRDQLPFRWLSGNQTPDHNTLSRFYRIHREGFHHLFHASVEHAARHGQIDQRLQAVDGTKLWANAAGDRMLTAEQLADLRVRVEREIARLDAGTESEQASPDDDLPSGGLPSGRQELTDLHGRIQRAEERITEGRKKGNLTDPDAHQMTAKGINRPGYNAQTVVRGVRGGGRLIVAVDVRTRADDHGILHDLAMQATVNTGDTVAVTVADKGYYSSDVLAACHDRGLPVVMAIPRRPKESAPYGADTFIDDPVTGGVICPEGVLLPRWQNQAKTEVRYGAPDTACRVCPAAAHCHPGGRRGRVVVRKIHHAHATRHRHLMEQPQSQVVQKQRSGLIEGVFGTLKSRHRARQCLLRGLTNVKAEWTLLATAFNLWTLIRLPDGHQHPDTPPQDSCRAIGTNMAALAI